MILLTLIGVWGGVWLWKELSSANMFESGVPIYVKIIGSMGLVVLIAFVTFGFLIFYQGDQILIRAIIEQGTKLMYFVAIYDIGYLISIWKPFDEKDKSEGSTFKIKTKQVVFTISILTVYLVICFIIIYLITKELFSLIFQYFAIGGVGACLGWIFWEHLKETQVLSGELLKNLKIVSVIFEIPVIFIAIIGIISNILLIPQMDSFVLLCYLFLFYLLVAYFMGLTSQTIKK